MKDFSDISFTIDLMYLVFSFICLISYTAHMNSYVHDGDVTVLL